MQERRTQPKKPNIVQTVRWLGVCALVFAAACGKKAPPTVEPKAPTPAPVIPVVVEPPVVTNWSVPSAMPQTKYLSEITATLQRDSAGRALEEHVETRGIISLQGRRDSLGAFRGTGTVDSFTVRGLERVLTPNQGETSTSKPVPALPDAPLSVAFEVSLDARMIRISTRPPLTNECDRPESGATNLVRDVIVRLPKTLTVGATWQDSTVGFVCRLGVPITTRTKSSFIVVGTEQTQGRTQLLVRKTADVTMAGELRSTWRTMSVNATGTSTLNSRIDAETGVVRSVDGEGLLTIKLLDTSRRDGSGAQEVRQQTRVRVTARP